MNSNVIELEKLKDDLLKELFSIMSNNNISLSNLAKMLNIDIDILEDYFLKEKNIGFLSYALDFVKRKVNKN